MKKVLFFGALAGMVSFYACKKESTVTVTNTVHDTTTIKKTDTVTVFASGKINADSLTAAINLIYSTKVSDATFPTASTDADAPVLDTDFIRSYSVVRSRYLTVYPPNVSGYVAGYYVQIVGAKSYFKVDYPEAETLRKAARQGRMAKDGKNISARGTGDGYIDSTLVFKLPASVNGDTFYIKYAAYDLSNRVSKAVTAMVVFLPGSDAASNAAISGNWKFSGSRTSYNGVFNNDWSVDTGSVDTQYYTCDNNTLTETEEETDYNLPYSIYSYSSGFTLSNNTMVSYYRQYQKYLDVENSTCSNLVYTISNDNQEESTGGYTYDARSKKFTFIQDGNSNINPYYSTYTVSELTASTLILSIAGGEGGLDENYTQFVKFTKQ